MGCYAPRKFLVALPLTLVVGSCGTGAAASNLTSDEIRDPAHGPDDQCDGPEQATPPAQPRGIEFRTDHERYTLSQVSGGLVVNIPFTYLNRTGRTIYVANCRQIEQIALEKKRCEQWIPAWAGAYAACLSPPLVIPRGSSHSGAVDVFAGTPGSSFYPQFQVSDPEGTYRLVWNHLYWSFDPNRYPFGEELPSELRVSAEFTLAAPR
jgi:hypothetical protein